MDCGRSRRAELSGLVLAPSIFISYRRSDAAGHAQNLCSELGRFIDKNELFLDLIRLSQGGDLEAELNAAIEACIGFIAVMGPDWLDGLSKPNDWVRKELALARCKNKPVLPVCIGVTSPPEAHSLPPDIPPFTERCVRLSTEAWIDVQPIVEWLNALSHDVELAGVRFHRLPLPATSDHAATSIYLSEDTHHVSEWAERLRSHMTGAGFETNVPSTSLEAQKLLGTANTWLRSRRAGTVELDLPSRDELERAHAQQTTAAASKLPFEILTAEAQLCKDRTPASFATIELGAPDSLHPGQPIARRKAFREADRPIHLALRRLRRGTQVDRS